MNRKFISVMVVATTVALGGSVLGAQTDAPEDQTPTTPPAPYMMGPGMMGAYQMGPYMMMNPGMMGSGQYMMGPRMMGPGMMAYGPMGSNMMGPGRMGPGMMAPGMMGPGMMGQYMMGRAAPALDLSADDVKSNMERWLAWNRNPNLKLGKVKEKDKTTITAEIVTKDNSLVQKYEIDRATGFMRPAG